MFGGPPIMSAPQFSPPMPTQGYPAPRYTNQPQPQPAPRPEWQQPVPREQAQAQEPEFQPQSRGPIYRGKMEEKPVPEPRPSPAEAPPIPPERPVALLSLPAPEELGVSAAPPSAAGIDWSAVHCRLDRLGALSFHQEKRTDGSCRVTFLLPTERQDRAHHVEAVSDSMAEAATLALEQAEKWAGQK
jgi:hypothetical protein